jgi:hypothetical protein
MNFGWFKRGCAAHGGLNIQPFIDKHREQGLKEKLPDPPVVPAGMKPTVLGETTAQTELGTRGSVQTKAGSSSNAAAKTRVPSMGTSGRSQENSANQEGGQNTLTGEAGKGGPSSSDLRSHSEDRTSEEYCSTPEYEWNGWEKVYRGKKKVWGPTGT